MGLTCDSLPCLQGQPVVSVAWGAWAGAGMASSDPALVTRLRKVGISAINPSAGLSALEIVTAQGAQAGSSSMAAGLLWENLLVGSRRRKALYREFIELAAVPAPAPAASSRSDSIVAIKHVARELRRKTVAQSVAAVDLPVWTSMPAEERSVHFAQLISAAVAQAVGRAVQPEEALMAAGLDSLGEWMPVVLCCWQARRWEASHLSFLLRRCDGGAARGWHPGRLGAPCHCGLRLPNGCQPGCLRGQPAAGTHPPARGDSTHPPPHWPPPQAVCCNCCPGTRVQAGARTREGTGSCGRGAARGGCGRFLPTHDRRTGLSGCCGAPQGAQQVSMPAAVAATGGPRSGHSCPTSRYISAHFPVSRHCLLLSPPLPTPAFCPCSLFDVELGPTVVFDYPTIEALAGWLAAQVPNEALAPPAAAGGSDAEDSESSEGTDEEAAVAAAASSPNSLVPASAPDSLAIVPAASKELAPPNTRAPKLSRPGYFTVPSLRHLQHMSDTELRAGKLVAALCVGETGRELVGGRWGAAVPARP